MWQVLGWQACAQEPYWHTCCEHRSFWPHIVPSFTCDIRYGHSYVIVGAPASGVIDLKLMHCGMFHQIWNYFHISHWTLPHRISGTSHFMYSMSLIPQWPNRFPWVMTLLVATPRFSLPLHKISCTVHLVNTVLFIAVGTVTTEIPSCTYTSSGHWCVLVAPLWKVTCIDLFSAQSPCWPDLAVFAAKTQKHKQLQVSECNPADSSDHVYIAVRFHSHTPLLLRPLGSHNTLS